MNVNNNFNNNYNFFNNNNNKNKNNFQNPGFINNIKSKLIENISNNNNFNDINKIPVKENDIFSLIKHPSSKGLVNINDDCYMNSAIQCLAHIRQLSKYLLNFNHSNKIIDKNKYKLTYSYIEVLNSLWLNNNINYYSLKNFKDIINKISPLFEKKQVNYSKALVLFILETMHNELNKPNKNNQTNLIGILNQFDLETTFHIFKNYFYKNYNSIISNLFYGIYNSKMTCLNCNKTEYNLQSFNILIFPFEEVRKYKNKKNNTIDIIECFEYYQKQNSNQFYCNNCQTISNSNDKTQLIIGPNILVISLNRGKGLEFNVKIDFDEYLDIKNFIYYKEESPSFYELIGIVSYYESSNMNGHFIAFCKSFVDNQWYKYNDTEINLSSFQEARSTCIPYTLFYSCIKRRN